MEKLTTETFQRWINWVSKIRDDLEGIINYQQICRHFEDVVNANLDHIKANNGKIFCDFIRQCYAINAAACIRRHTKNEKDSISLMRLLDQIKKSADQFTYEFYLMQYPINPIEPPWQKSTFLNFSKNKKSISAEIIQEDMQKIEDIATKVSDFVDRFIAHLDQRGLEEKITYNDLSNSLDLFNRITCRYLSFISSAGYVTLQPTIQIDWEKIFTVPLDMRKYD